MLKVIFRTAAIVAMMAVLAACQQTGQAGSKIAFVDAGKVFKECKAGVAGVDYLKKESEKFQETFKSMQSAMSQNKTQANTEEFQKAVTEYRTKMGAEQNRIISVINDAFSKAVDTYRANNGIDAVLSIESAVSYDPKADISADIISAMDKMDIQIAPAEGDTPAAATDSAKTEAAPAENK